MRFIIVLSSHLTSETGCIDRFICWVFFISIDFLVFVVLHHRHLNIEKSTNIQALSFSVAASGESFVEQIILALG